MGKRGPKPYIEAKLRLSVALYVAEGWPEECVLWDYSKHSEGYGVLVFDGVPATLVHRAVWFLVKGFWPTETIDHLCRIRPCFNLSHLEEVSNAENARRGFMANHAAHMARRSAITHCPLGHEYTPENLRATVSGNRSCKTCHRNRERERRIIRRNDS